MSYPANTVLERIEPLPDAIEQRPRVNKEGEQIGLTDVPVPNPLNVIRIVGPSPVKSVSREEWAGAAGDQIIVAPVEQFGANEVIPESVLNSDYDVREYGEDSAPVKIQLDPREKLRQGRSPEEVFAAAAREQPKEEKPKRARTPIKADEGEAEF